MWEVTEIALKITKSKTLRAWKLVDSETGEHYKTVFLVYHEAVRTAEVLNVR